MNLTGSASHLVARVLGPLPKWVRAVTTWASVMVIWGSAWMPGGIYVALFGWLLLVSVTAYSLGRRFLRAALRMHYHGLKQETPDSERYHYWRLGLIFFATTSPVLALPLRLNLLLHWPSFHRYTHKAYYVDSMIYPEAPPRTIGVFAIREFRTSTQGVAIVIRGGGVITWLPPECGNESFDLTTTIWVAPTYRASSEPAVGISRRQLW